MGALKRTRIPEHWVEVPLLKISSYIRGVSYKKGVESNSFMPGTIKLLRANNIDENQINYNDIIFIPQSFVSDKQLLVTYDIIIAMSSGSINVVGKTAQFLGNNERMTVGAFCGILRPSKK